MNIKILDNSKSLTNNDKDFSKLYTKIVDLINTSRSKIVSTINTTMVYTYFEIGRMIVEEEQKGKERADYATYIIKNLSKKLSEQFGKGFDTSNLKRMRQFYRMFSIGETVSHQFKLSWSHYVILIKIEDPLKRSFYEIETINNNWSVRELERQKNSSLYERLALSRDKEKVLELSKKGQVIETAKDIIKSPIVLEFLGLDEKKHYSESDLEGAIISQLQKFLLELGKGFLFEARQKRFTLDDQNFFVDLVLYNRLLRYYVLIDLKIGKITHQDLGQMQMYVNYYDRYVKLDSENKTIGILLCEENSKAVVKLTLPEDSNIMAAEYNLYLPDKELLERKLKEFRELAEDRLLEEKIIEDNNGSNI